MQPRILPQPYKRYFNKTQLKAEKAAVIAVPECAMRLLRLRRTPERSLVHRLCCFVGTEMGGLRGNPGIWSGTLAGALGYDLMRTYLLPIELLAANIKIKKV